MDKTKTRSHSEFSQAAYQQQYAYAPPMQSVPSNSGHDMSKQLAAAQPGMFPSSGGMASAVQQHHQPQMGGPVPSQQQAPMVQPGQQLSRGQISAMELNSYYQRPNVQRSMPNMTRNPLAPVVNQTGQQPTSQYSQIQVVQSTPLHGIHNAMPPIMVNQFPQMNSKISGMEKQPSTVTDLAISPRANCKNKEKTSKKAQNKIVLNFNYNQDQWSPLNPEGKRKYDRDFLIQLQTHPMALRKPCNLLKLDIIKDKAHIQRLTEVNRAIQQAPVSQIRTYNDPFMPNYARGAAKLNNLTLSRDEKNMNQSNKEIDFEGQEQQKIPQTKTNYAKRMPNESYTSFDGVQQKMYQNKSNYAKRMPNENNTGSGRHQRQSKGGCTPSSSETNKGSYLESTGDPSRLELTKKLEFTISPTKVKPKTQMSMEEIHNSLLTLLKRFDDNEGIFDWIDGNVSETTETKFIRALVTAVHEDAIVVTDSSNELDTAKMRKRTTLLKRYIDHDETLQLQALFAVQGLMNQLEHPSGLLHQIFEVLYVYDVITEDAFTQWEQSGDPNEVEGKSVAVHSSKAFFMWLRDL